MPWEWELDKDAVHSGIVVEVFNCSEKLIATSIPLGKNGLGNTSCWVTDSGKIW